MTRAARCRSRGRRCGSSRPRPPERRARRHRGGPQRTLPTARRVARRSAARGRTATMGSGCPRPAGSIRARLVASRHPAERPQLDGPIARPVGRHCVPDASTGTTSRRRSASNPRPTRTRAAPTSTVKLGRHRARRDLQPDELGGRAHGRRMRRRRPAEQALRWSTRAAPRTAAAVSPLALRASTSRRCSSTPRCFGIAHESRDDQSVGLLWSVQR
jgi:hypothetical protein